MSVLNYEVVKIPNCWIGYIIPGGTNNKPSDWKNRQEACIKKNCFGMGYKSKDKNRSTDAASRVVAGDLIIWRAYNSHYYIGIVKSKIDDLLTNPSYGIDLGIGFEVERWYDLKTEVGIPGCVVGRFSQRLHSTFQIIDDMQTRMTLVQLVESIKDLDSVEDIVLPVAFKNKMILNERNIIKSLDANALEDLMYLYMKYGDNNTSYDLVPSSCKVSRMKYEFIMRDANNDLITCQVKNRRWFDPEEYSEEEYSKIYLCSGAWSEDECNEYSLKYANSRIVIVSPRTLFEFVEELKKSDSLKHWYYYLFPKEYYVFSETIAENQLFPFGWSRKKQIRKNSSHVYRACFNHYCFKENKGDKVLRYYPDWNLVISGETISEDENELLEIGLS